MNRRDFLRRAAALAVAPAAACLSSGRAERPNLLFITLDDVNADSAGCYGGGVPDATPNVDRLAAEGARFERGHVTISACRASRSVLLTGRYPHRNGTLGTQPVSPGVPLLSERLAERGYRTGIFGKVDHLRPVARFRWSVQVGGGRLGEGRDPARYHRAALRFFERTAQDDRPFFLMANAHDAHRPFAGTPEARRHFGEKARAIPAPSRSFGPDEVPVPAFLPDLPEVRGDLAAYFGSVRRGDDTVGALLRALEDAGKVENTLVLLISDNGMSFPFAKTCCWPTSTRVPWIVRWPGVVEPGRVDERHFVSGIDVMPTLLEAAGLHPPPETDGRSFLPLLRGRSQEGRDRVVTVLNEDWHGGSRPIRCLQQGGFAYLFNAWADGEAIFSNEAQRSRTMAAMRRAAKSDREVAARVRFFLRRTPEELYDVAADPNSLRNLAGRPRFAAQRDRMRRELLDWMESTDDPLAPTFRQHIGA